MIHRHTDFDVYARGAKKQRTGGKRTVYGDSPGKRARVVPSGAQAEAADAGEPNDRVDAFWRDALDRIN